jgi:hypothetical protein
VAQQSQRRFVVERIRLNVESEPPAIDQETIWRTHMQCLLSSQQRLGPDSLVSVLLDSRPFLLSLAECRQQGAYQLVHKTLREIGATRFTNTIPERVDTNLARLEQGGWAELQGWIARLRAAAAGAAGPEHYKLERDAADLDEAQRLWSQAGAQFWQTLG